MNQDLRQAFVELKDLLSLVPVSKEQSFHIEAVNGAGVSVTGVIHNAAFSLDRLTMDASKDTKWTIQPRDIHFIVLSGSVLLRFKLKDNIYNKPLNIKHSLRIPTGIPFMLKTYEQDTAMLLISVTGGIYGRTQ